MTQDLDILLNIDKPLHWTSFDVCNALKRNYPRKTKIGHAGTLDPLASGVLLVAVGKATKKIESLQAMTKEYIATITLGAVTKTYDAEFYPDIINNTDDISKSKIETVIKEFVGEIEQVPPIYSAIKVEGKRAYELARKGLPVELKKRIITIEYIDLISYNCHNGITTFQIKVACSKGTYIRTLAHDIGKSLGCGAFLSGLIRSKIGEYSVESAIALDTIIVDKKAQL
jgi:tRNA pseudouridine55 synthase